MKINRLKIYACSSAKSKSGLSRIIKLVSPEIESIRLNNFDQIQNVSITDSTRFFLHNIGTADPEIQIRSVIFGLQSLTMALINDNKTIEHFRKYPPIEIWVNSETACQKLLSSGYNVKVMYRPNLVIVPDQYIPMPMASKVLLSWNELDIDYMQHLQLITQTIQLLPNIEFLFFPTNKLPIKTSNAIALGKINFSNYYHQVRGMIRITDQYDLGRSMFDMVSGGRWVLTYKLDEPFTHAIQRLDELKDNILFCLENYNDTEGMRLWDYARENFSELALRKKWITEMKRVFNL